NSGLADHESSYVGRFFVVPHPWFSARYSFQVDEDSLSAQRNRLSLSAGPAALRVAMSYIYVDRLTQSALSRNIEQLGTTVTSRLSQSWRVQARYLTSLADEDEGWLFWGGSLIYEDECILAGLDLSRRYIGSRDNPPDTAI